MSKYIITNCPAYRTECEEIFNFLGSEKIFNACIKSAGISCKDITDCILKRIFNIVKDEVLIGGINEVAENVIELLEIEEVDDTN